jgi:hypothetical protein
MSKTNDDKVQELRDRVINSLNWMYPLDIGDAAMFVDDLIDEIVKVLCHDQLLSAMSAYQFELLLADPRAGHASTGVTDRRSCGPQRRDSPGSGGVRLQG